VYNRKETNYYFKGRCCQRMQHSLIVDDVSIRVHIIEVGGLPKCN
jgi:hypothetical protein